MKRARRQPQRNLGQKLSAAIVEGYIFKVDQGIALWVRRMVMQNCASKQQLQRNGCHIWYKALDIFGTVARTLTEPIEMAD
jgi:hypothetical protein